MEVVKFVRNGIQFTFIKTSETKLYSGDVDISAQPVYIGYDEYSGCDMSLDMSGASHITYGDANMTLKMMYHRWLKETKLLRSLGMQF